MNTKVSINAKKVVLWGLEALSLRILKSTYILSEIKSPNSFTVPVVYRVPQAGNVLPGQDLVSTGDSFNSRD